MWSNLNFTSLSFEKIDVTWFDTNQNKYFILYHKYNTYKPTDTHFFHKEKENDVEK